MGKLLIEKGYSLSVSNSGSPNIDGIYMLQNGLANARKYYIKNNPDPLVDFGIGWSPSEESWVLYTIVNGTPTAGIALSNNPTENPWESTWDNGMNVGVVALTNKKVSIKKQNISKISVINGLSDYFIFLGGSNNTIGTFLNSAELTGNNDQALADRIILFIDGAGITYSLREDGMTWRRAGDSTSQNNTVILPNTIVALASFSNKVLTMQGTNIIQKLNSGKLTLSKDLLKTLSNQIDSAISNLTADNSTLKLFSTEQPNGICCQGDNSTDPINPIYIRNINCWAKDIDTSPISIWNNGGGYPVPEHAGGSGGTGLLITRKHLIFAEHFHVKPGKKLIFVDMNNNVYIRTLLNVQHVLVYDPWLGANVGTDILVGVLDSDLPNSVSNIKILDPNIATRLTSELVAKRMAVFLMNVERKVFVGELITNGGFLQISNNPTNPSKRREFYPYNTTFGYAMNFGDSANTCSIVYKNKLVHVFHFRYPNSGPLAYLYVNKINEAINSLGNPDNYALQIEDFKDYAQ